jgi:hypothetical protein
MCAFKEGWRVLKQTGQLFEEKQSSCATQAPQIGASLTVAVPTEECWRVLKPGGRLLVATWTHKPCDQVRLKAPDSDVSGSSCRVFVWRITQQSMYVAKYRQHVLHAACTEQVRVINTRSIVLECTDTYVCVWGGLECDVTCMVPTGDWRAPIQHGPDAKGAQAAGQSVQVLRSAAVGAAQGLHHHCRQTRIHRRENRGLERHGTALLARRLAFRALLEGLQGADCLTSQRLGHAARGPRGVADDERLQEGSHHPVHLHIRQAWRQLASHLGKSE